jgi:uncharacterized membrane protein
MTASKSSRARNARAAAQARAAANATGGGTAVKNRDRNQARTVAAGRGPRTPVVEEDPGLRGAAPWMQIATFVLALAGLGVSIYLTIAHFSDSALAGCSESGLINCTRVTTSQQSYVFGIPVAVLGLAFYVFVVAIMSPWAWQARRREIHMLRIAAMVVGIGFVLYLIYAELIIIGSICLYCTSVHAITFVLFVLTAFAAAAWGIRPGATWRIPLGRKTDPEAASA